MTGRLSARCIEIIVESWRKLCYNKKNSEPERGKEGSAVIELLGRGVCAGIVRGRLHCYHRVGAAAAKCTGADPEWEKSRLAEAQAKARAQLEALVARCRRDVGDGAAQVFATHAMLLEDEDYVQHIVELLHGEQCCAEYAVQQTGKAFSALFEVMDDPYMRERGADVLDVTWRLLRSLAGAGSGGAMPRGPAILAADDLNLSEFIELDREQVLAIVIRQDSPRSHAALLTKLLGIPAICGVGYSLEPEYHGRMARLDGLAGTLTIY